MSVEEAPDDALLVTNLRLNKGAAALFFTDEELYRSKALVLDFRVARKGPNGWLPTVPPEEITFILPQSLASDLLTSLLKTLLPLKGDSNEATESEGV